MPYIITTKTPIPEYEPGSVLHFRDITRRAVATLDEARRTVELDIIERHRASVDRWRRDWQIEAYALPERGGTIGPLPDGTVIEVERVTDQEIVNRLPRSAVAGVWREHPAAVSSDVLVAAYNAAQEVVPA